MIGRAMFLVWMSAALAVGAVKAESPPDSSGPAVDAKPSIRTPAAIRADVSAALAAEAKSRRLGGNTPQVMRLVKLYREMAAHPQRDTSPTFKELGQQVRSRLVTVRNHIERKISDANRSLKKQKVAPPITAPESRVLAQQLPPPGANQAGVAQGIAVTGIPRAAPTATDYGPELVELIEATISPAIWNVNGGPGAIVYYAPLHVLVVAAPDQVHEQVGDALGKLHAAQRAADGVQVVAEVGAVGARN